MVHRAYEIETNKSFKLLSHLLQCYIQMYFGVLQSAAVIYTLKRPIDYCSSCAKRAISALESDVC